MSSYHYTRYFIGLAAIVTALTGCVSTHFVAKPEENFASSPNVVMLTKQTYAARTVPGDVEFYYFGWNFLTVPNAVKDWKEIYVMGEPSSPTWAFEKVAEVVLAKRGMEDAAAFAELRDITSRIGGDAIIDLRRDPMIDAPKFGSRIIGYKYLSTVVRRREK